MVRQEFFFLLQTREDLANRTRIQLIHDLAMEGIILGELSAETRRPRAFRQRVVTGIPDVCSRTTSFRQFLKRS